MVSNEMLDCVNSFLTSGWGDTGNETATDILQETVMTITDTSECLGRMEHIENIDERLIICAKGKNTGPCKVKQ